MGVRDILGTLNLGFGTLGFVKIVLNVIGRGGAFFFCIEVVVWF